jgi:hypothetical protein
MSEVEQILLNRVKLIEDDSWSLIGSPNSLIKELETLISTAVREARVDELEHIISGSEYSDDDFDWYEITKDEYVGTKYYSEVRHLDKDSRIAQLKETLFIGTKVAF